MNVKLNDLELAALDFLIASRKAGVLPPDFTNDVFAYVVPATQIIQAIQNVAAGPIEVGANLSDAARGGFSLEGLMRVRADALRGKSK